MSDVIYVALNLSGIQVNERETLPVLEQSTDGSMPQLKMVGK